VQFYDIFNGDADGICALHQLRLEEPRSAVLVTGAKREIALVERADAGSGDELTVLDIAFSTNARAVLRALERGARCRYFDHHHAGAVPQHPNLKTYIDTAPDTCTSLIVDRYLSGRQRIWAVVAAFGEGERVPRAVDDVGHEQAAEEQHFGDQERPHAQHRRVELLLERVEVVLERRRVRVVGMGHVSQSAPPARTRSGTAARSRPGSP